MGGQSCLLAYRLRRPIDTICDSCPRASVGALAAFLATTDGGGMERAGHGPEVHRVDNHGEQAVHGHSSREAHRVHPMEEAVRQS